MIQQERPTPEQSKPVMENGIVIQQRCLWCNHFVPVNIKEGEVFIAGHSYREETVSTSHELAKQIGGGMVEMPHTTYGTEHKHCDGGSLKIIGYEIEDATEKVRPVEKFEVPKGDRIIRVSVRDGILRIHTQ